MAVKPLSPDFAVAPQLTARNVAEAARRGFRTIISNRPDGEDRGQPSARDMADLADRHGLRFAHVPVVPGAVTPSDVAHMAAAVEASDGPVLAFCRSGARSAMLWAMIGAGRGDVDTVLDATAAAGYELGALRAMLDAQAGGRTQTEGRA